MNKAKRPRYRTFKGWIVVNDGHCLKEGYEFTNGDTAYKVYKYKVQAEKYAAQARRRHQEVSVHPVTIAFDRW